MINEDLLQFATAVGIAAAPTIALALLALFYRQVRSAIFYKRVEYDLASDREKGESPFSRKWSINWEENRLIFEAGDISNDNIKDVKFTSQSNREEKIPIMYPSDTFISLFEDALQVKVNSIIRQKQKNGDTYILRFVVRRRRL